MEPIEQEYSTTEELTHIFGKTRNTLWRWGKTGKFPKPTKAFGNPLWHRDDIKNFKESL